VRGAAKGKEVKRMEICGDCVFCLIGIDGERLCSLASNEYVTKDEDNEWIAGRLVHPEDECIYPEGSGPTQGVLLANRSDGEKSHRRPPKL